MNFTTSIPLEIQEVVIDILAQDDEDLLSLKACSLVCKTFVPITRKHIFASITVNSDRIKRRTTSSLEQLLSANPQLADYIRRLVYTMTPEDLTSFSVHRCLKRLTRLQSLSIFCYEKLNWSDNPLRPALLHLLHLPTLTLFAPRAFDNLVATDFIPCTNLKELVIDSHSTGMETIQEHPFSGPLPDQPVQLHKLVSDSNNSTAILSYCTAQRPDGRPVFDLSCLAKLSVDINVRDDLRAIRKLFKRTGQLTDVEILYAQPESIYISLADLLGPSIQTLKHLFIHIFVHNNVEHPLVKIPAELEKICRNTKNVLETLEISVQVSQMNSTCKVGEDWGRLDQVLTDSGWRKLQEVRLEVEVYAYGRQYEEGLRRLPEGQLARLNQSKSIEFEFNVHKSY